ncbi:GNAT family acetyltransferase [Companilactobacillus suantsaicola]|uniref:GNAT family acetyltransferase n=1 Tax=Companilactobacillus suantsaicola TaxID=2487723 RepID=A0A4Z0JP96_9LACO|nr:GNAT family acetyltransferase [Companilactobacillus suantsaicola]TGD24924.1 GNAT family acetyltransferase [Companilactobacillus suantsaicola]
MAYNIIQLKELMDQEYDLSKLFSTFSSINEDVENFLLNKSEQFETMDLARTYLIFSKYRGENILAGYYSITNKPLMMSKKNFSRLSNTLRKRLLGMGQKTERENYEIKSILLGQIGKNFNYKNSISGTDILKLSYITISQVYQLIGGRIIYLEVDNNDKLRSFYTNNGFKEIDNYRTPNEQCLFIKRISDIL